MDCIPWLPLDVVVLHLTMSGGSVVLVASNRVQNCLSGDVLGGAKTLSHLIWARQCKIGIAICLQISVAKNLIFAQVTLNFLSIYIR